MTGHTAYTVRQAAYDLRKLRGKELIANSPPSPPLPPLTAERRSIAALLTLRERVIGPILAGVRNPRMGRKPVTRTKVDRDYEKSRIDISWRAGRPSSRPAVGRGDARGLGPPPPAVAGRSR